MLVRQSGLAAFRADADRRARIRASPGCSGAHGDLRALQQVLSVCLCFDHMQYKFSSCFDVSKVPLMLIAA